MDRTVNTGLDDKLGWFNSISSGDIDNDGDTDFIVGNTGYIQSIKLHQQTQKFYIMEILKVAVRRILLRLSLNKIYVFQEEA